MRLHRTGRQGQGQIKPGNARHDADYKVIGINNCASCSISFDKNDFITPLKPVRQQVKGLGGVLDGLQIGTIEWTIEDDEGMPYIIKLPGRLYVPNSPSRLLSPQYWAQTASGDQPVEFEGKNVRKNVLVK
jgi:hypothetical protein